MGPSIPITLVALAAGGVLLVVAVRTDLRERRIPNRVVLALMGDWLLWRLALGACACWLEASGQLGSSFPLGVRFLAGAWDARPLGLPSAAEGLISAVMFGIGLLALTLAYEGLLKREALGGGDVKLVAALALFLGLARSALCLIVACVVALIGAAWGQWRSRKKARTTLRQQEMASCGDPNARGHADGGTTLPFAPALAIGAVVAILPGVAFSLMA